MNNTRILKISKFINKILFLSLISVALGLKFKSPTGETSQRNFELFKYSPDDEYTLPEDIDDEKPPTNFVGNIMQAKTLVLENKNHGKGKFKYSIETQNGIELTQIGKLKDANTFVISGSYSYTGADGRRYKVKYTADEFGYHPITELDLDIVEIQGQQPNQQPLRLIDLSQLTGFNKLDKKQEKSEGYTYTNSIEEKDKHSYIYPTPSPDLTAPTIFN